MNPLDDSILQMILQHDGSSMISGESDMLEYKADFDWSNKEKRAKYCKTMAAMCNNKGGYIVFGVDDNMRTIMGISGFETVDSADITSHLNNYFSPAIVFEKRLITAAGRAIGVIYIEKYTDIPAICTKSFDTVLKDGAIYYRYPGKSDYMKGIDLIHYLHHIKGGDSKELVDLKKKEMKQSAMPILITGNGSSGGQTFDIMLKNQGKRARILGVDLLAGDCHLFGSTYPRWLEEGQYLTIQGRTLNGLSASLVSWEIEVSYSDAIGNKYKIDLNGKGAAFKLSEPEEIN